MKYFGSLWFTFALVLLILCSGCSSINSNIIGQPDSQREEKIITYTNAAELIDIPDKIIYYHQGNQITIDKNNDKFDKIVKATKDRVFIANDVYKLAFSQSDLEGLKQKNDVLEFIYPRAVSVNWKYNADLDFIYSFNYNSIIFPLTGQWNDMVFFLPNSPGPLGLMGSEDELLKLLKN